MNSVSEQIDERILRLLGLEDVFDLDYDTYLNEIRAAMVLGANKLPPEELALLANERKRIRGKKGRFRPKKQKITADKIATTKFLKPTKKTVSLTAPVSKQDSAIQQQGPLSIGKPLESISKTLVQILNLRKKTNEEERKDRETQRRSKREEGLEGFKKGISAISSAAKAMLAPFQNIIDRIWKFIFFTLLGRAFTQLMDWLGDPANKKKIDVLGRFLKDWWPTLLGGAVLFFTPFGKFVRTTLKLVGMLTAKLIKQIPKIASAVRGLGAFAAANPLVTIGVTGAAATFAGEMRRQGEEKKQVESEAKKRGVKPETVKIELEQAKRSPFAMFGEAMQNFGGFSSGGSIPRFTSGGIFGTGYDGISGSTGQKVSGFGVDTQMIVAQPGEIVMNKKTVDAVGAENFLAMNRQYGGPGANKPKMGKMYNTGGIVGMQGGGWLQQLGKFLPGTGTVMAPRTTGNSTVAGYQNKLLGVPLGKPTYPRDATGYGMGYSQAQMRRYESVDTNKEFRNTGGMLPQLVIRTSGTNNRRLDSAIQNARDVTNLPGGSAYRPLVESAVSSSIKKQQYYDQLRGVMRQAGMSGANESMDLRGNPIRRQGGGIIPQGPFTPLPSPGYVRPQGSFIPRPILRLPGPMPGTTVPFGYDPFRGLQGGGLIGGLDSLGRGVFENVGGTIGRNKGRQTNIPGGGWFGEQLGEREGRKKYEQLTNPFRRQGGGSVKENTGTDIKGATADRQLTALQPGEYVLPVDTVSRLGTSLIDKLVALTDSNSNPAKLGQKSINKPRITPLSRSGMSGMITLPPINQSSTGSGVGGSPAGSRAPKFSASSPTGADERNMNATIYGIV